MPFAGVIGTITGRLKQLGQQEGPRGTVASLYSRQAVPTDLLGIVTREQGGPSRPASGGVVKLGETEAVFSKLVEMGCFDFTTVATEVGVT